MREALREAQAALAAGEIPIGAVVVSRGRVIGRGHNMTERLIDTTAPGPRWAASCTAPSTRAAATPSSPLPSSIRARKSRPASWAKNARP